EFGRTITIVGETGCGKSLACDIFEKKYPTECFKVIISNLDTINDIIDKLMSKLNIKLETRSKSKKLQEITWVLISMRMRGGKPLIIFDEAEFMSHVTLCAIKSLYDHLNKIVGCVMIGTEQILRNYDRLKKTNKTGIPQLYRRIKFGIVNLPPIDKRYNEFLSEIKDKELVKWLRNNCENFGELHDVLEPAKREADRLKEPLSYELVMKINGFNW
ncbi:MAG: hypothetical protein H6Q15_2078, partial [Bacteroidetes bacterium]|nr:hypothetical protein [Bacteroidota bacterium]